MCLAAVPMRSFMNTNSTYTVSLHCSSIRTKLAWVVLNNMVLFANYSGTIVGQPTLFPDSSPY